MDIDEFTEGANAVQDQHFPVVDNVQGEEFANN